MSLSDLNTSVCQMKDNEVLQKTPNKYLALEIENNVPLSTPRFKLETKN